MRKANEKQVAGSHYRSTVQHWDLVVALEMGYFEGQITKYVTRWRKKNGVQDLEKASHFLQKLREVRSGREYTLVFKHPALFRIALDAFISGNQLTEKEAAIVELVAEWRTRGNLEVAALHLRELLESAREEMAPKQPEPECILVEPIQVCVCRHAEYAHPSGGKCSETNMGSACTCHGFTPDDGSAPGPGYVNQDR